MYIIERYHCFTGVRQPKN